MSIFNYKLPSGSTFQLTAPAGTTQAQADLIFYQQVAAGTFVGFNPGDTLTHPAEALTNFGLSRLERGTAGIDDQTLLAITAGLPTVMSLPTLSNIPIQNAITQADYIQVTSNPVEGEISQGVTAVGDLNSTQTQAVMAQTAAIVDQLTTEVTQENGVGKYGFNAQQLERAGYIKPGYPQMYCPIVESTQANPDNFLSFLESPSIWTGLDEIFSLADILGSESLQNKIQEILMQQSYDVLVSIGVIKSTAAATIPSASTGVVYSDTGVLSSASAESLLAINSNNVTTASTISIGTTVGNIPTGVSKLGTDASAAYSAGLGSLSTGAVGFSSSALTGVSASTGTTTPQLTGLATGLTGGNAASANVMIGSTVSSDVGALVANASKYGPALTVGWALSASALSTTGNTLSKISTAGIGNSSTNFSFSKITDGISTDKVTTALNGSESALAGPAVAQLNTLAKASQFGVNFSNFSISGLVSKVQPAAAFTNTVNRSTLDAATTRVIGSDKIASPTFAPPSAESLGQVADINQAKAFIAQAQSASTLAANGITQPAQAGKTLLG